MPNANHKLLWKRAKRALLSKFIDIIHTNPKHLREDGEMQWIEPENPEQRAQLDTGKNE